MTMNRFRKRWGKGGFTLVELMVVIAVISLLVAISLPVLSRIRQNAQNTKTEVELKAIFTAITMFYANNGRFPRNYEELRPFISIPHIEERYEINFATLG